MKFPFLKNTDSFARRRSSASWAWPSCHQPRTLSFRNNNNKNNNNNNKDVMFKTINSAYLEAAADESPESFFTDQSHDDYESASFSTCSEDDTNTMIRGLRSDRLFFEPDETSSLLIETKLASFFPFKDSVVLSLVSKDPYVDFREAMEEMVQAHGVKDWESLEELLCWFLKVNGRSNYGYIVGAFVDLLVGLELESASSPSITSSPHYSGGGGSTFSPVSTSSSSLCSINCVSCGGQGEKKAYAPASGSSSLLLEQVKEEITLED
ncbi:hypothetical protein RIF29_20749 [Crotalaria pallida]|uniref:Transcription repressor n=1 Tax=Crotalaria pallida TaxID=3830 RepID=A0AAN9F1S5_CROPI